MDTETLSFAAVETRHTAMDLIFRDKIISAELFNFMCGRFLGEGTSRYFFEYALDKRYVVKIDLGDTCANVAEFMIWNQIEYYEKMSQWFAPVSKMTKNGRVMLQRRCQTGIAYEDYPTKIPDFFTDLKYANWGKLNGKMVCMDYASTKLLEFTDKYRMVKANWWIG